MDNAETVPMDIEAWHGDHNAVARLVLDGVSWMQVMPTQPLHELDSDEMVGSGSEDLKSPSEDDPEPDDADMSNDDANDDDNSGEDDGSSDGDDVFRANFRAMKPSAVANLLQAIESHELFPFYCEYREPDGKFSFGSEPVEDILKWNSWLDKHGVSC